MRELNYFEAINEGIREEMQRDPRVFLMSHCVGRSGLGAGLRDIFGPERVRDAPLCENAETGCAVGAALTGMRPIVDLWYGGFMWMAMDQLVNQMAKDRYLFGGQGTISVVLRMYMGINSHNSAQHADRPYPSVMNIPGIRIVCPTTPYNAKGLWKSAIRHNNPVCIFEDMRNFVERSPVPEDEYLIPFGKPEVVREGDNVTLVAIFTRREALQAANELAKDGISLEVIDPLTLVPLGIDVILESVKKTGRLVIADVANDTCSAASHIAALVAEYGYEYLRAPIRRVCTPDVHIPFAPNLERLVYPTTERIVNAVRVVAQYKN